MYARVTAVQATDNHKLILTFDHLERRLFDMRPYLSIGRFAELRDVQSFRQVTVSFDTVEWENGLDLDPEFLYAKSVSLDEDNFSEPLDEALGATAAWNKKPAPRSASEPSFSR